MKGIEQYFPGGAMSPEERTKRGEMKSSSRCSRSSSRLRSSHVLLDVDAVAGIHLNRTTTTTLNRNGAIIQVSFKLKRPPQPSTLFVASVDLNPFVSPVILCSVDDLLLFRVNVGRRRAHLSLKHHWDYYVYRANGNNPRLHLLESPPNPVFRRGDVGLLPRPDGQYTVAALVETGCSEVYHLLLYHSDTLTWSTRKVSLEPPHWDPLPKTIPKYCSVLLRHFTTHVVTIGGKRGTMAWADAWRSILLCDVLDPNPTLRGVPIPLPSEQMSLNNGLGVQLDFGGHSRGISYNRDKGCLVLVHLERKESPHPIHAATRGLYGEIQVLDWEVTTWSKYTMSNSVKDWHKEHSVQASKITIDSNAVSQMLKVSELLVPRPVPPQDHSNDAASSVTKAQQQLQLHNLSMCQPTLCPNGADDMVYLVAREKYLDPKAWLLALDMKDGGTLKEVAYMGHRDHPFCHPIYCLSRISKFTNPKMRLKSLATDPVSVDDKESN